MTPEAFRTAFQPYADQAAAGTGLSADLFLAQWAVETAYASSFAGWYNLGNITRGGAANGFVNYTSYAQFTNAEILLLHDIPYEGVLLSAGKSLADQCIALGRSPWDAGHYDNGGGPGSSLIAVLPVFGLSAEQIGSDMTSQEHDWLEAILNATTQEYTTQRLTAQLTQVEADLKAAIAATPASGGAALTATQAQQLSDAHDAILRIESALKGA